MARIIQVKVKPQSRKCALSENEDGTWFAEVKSPPVDGKANEELIALVASHFACRKNEVSVKSGTGARMKLIKIEV